MFAVAQGVFTNNHVEISTVIASRRRSNPAMRHLGVAKPPCRILPIYSMALGRRGWIASQGLAMTEPAMERLLFNTPSPPSALKGVSEGLETLSA
jgi:hypothetical protein